MLVKGLSEVESVFNPLYFDESLNELKKVLCRYFPGSEVVDLTEPVKVGPNVVATLEDPNGVPPIITYENGNVYLQPNPRWSYHFELHGDEFIYYPPGHFDGIDTGVVSWVDQAFREEIIRHVPLLKKELDLELVRYYYTIESPGQELIAAIKELKVDISPVEVAPGVALISLYTFFDLVNDCIAPQSKGNFVMVDGEYVGFLKGKTLMVDFPVNLDKAVKVLKPKEIDLTFVKQ